MSTFAARTRQWKGAAAAFVLAALAVSGQASAQDRSSGNGALKIHTVSTEANRVSGGDVLVQIDHPGNGPNKPLVVRLNGSDISAAFRPGREPNSLIGLVTG